MKIALNVLVMSLFLSAFMFASFLDSEEILANEAWEAAHPPLPRCDKAVDAGEECISKGRPSWIGTSGSLDPVVLPYIWGCERFETGLADGRCDAIDGTPPVETLRRSSYGGHGPWAICTIGAERQACPYDMYDGGIVFEQDVVVDNVDCADEAMSDRVMGRIHRSVSLSTSMSMLCSFNGCAFRQARFLCKSQ